MDDDARTPRWLFLLAAGACAALTVVALLVTLVAWFAPLQDPLNGGSRLTWLAWLLVAGLGAGTAVVSLRAWLRRGPGRWPLLLAAAGGALVLVAGLGVALIGVFADSFSEPPTFSASTSATVVAVTDHVEKGFHTGCSVDYVLSVDGTPHTGTSRTSGRFCRLAVDDVIEVTYEPSDPAVSAPAARYDSHAPLRVGGLAVGAAGLAGAVVAAVLWVRRRPLSLRSRD